VRADIIIVNFLSADDVVRCLTNLGNWDAGQVWIVDNSQSEPGGDLDHERLIALAQTRTDVRLLTPPNNLGFGGGCNYAYSRSDSEVVALLNPDSMIAREDLLKLVDLMGEDAKLGAIAPAMYWNKERSFLVPPSVPQTPAATLANAISERVPFVAHWLARTALERTKEISSRQHVQEVDFLTGAVLLARRSAINSASQEFGQKNDVIFDPSYFMFFEDSDLSVRLRRSGWRLGIAPHVRAIHEYRHKHYKLGLMAQSREIYFKKCFPLFFRLTQDLSLLERFACKVLPSKRFQLSLGSVVSHEEFNHKCGGAKLLALSPSMLARPALFRPPGFVPRSLSEDEWGLLEPGNYAALIQGDAGRPVWCHFERTFPE
jgi:GT2 family glycosyltransferase